MGTSKVVGTCLVLLILCRAVSSNGQKLAKQLLHYDNIDHKLILNPVALAELSSLEAPLTVIAAIGDARVGKSTTLNHVEHFLQGNKGEDIAEVFNTSNQMAPCTRGVWMSVSKAGSGGRTVLLDVEGSNLGNDERTDQYSTFTALLSSALMLFGEGTLTNHNRNFLFRLTRVTKEIWRDELRDAAISHFPGMRVVVKQPLDAPQGASIKEHITQSLIGSGDEIAGALKTFFPKDKISVSRIQSVQELKKLKKGLQNDKYKQDVTDLVRALKLAPTKKTPSGAPMSGQVLQDLATRTVDALNRNSWLSLADTFIALEKSFCDKSFNSLVRPLHSGNYRSVNAKMDDVLKQFGKQCVLNGERAQARRWIEDIIRDKQMAEEKERQRAEEQRRREKEERRQRELREQRRLEEEQEKRRMEQERQRQAAEERRRREEEARARKAEQDRRAAEQRAAALRQAEERARRRRKSNNVGKILAGVAVLAGIFGSDERLKENITTIPGSEYEVLGLRGVKWVWNEKARALGLQGAARGVIAQEVEIKYPQAVHDWKDGYKRVDYALLCKLLDKNRGSLVEPTKRTTRMYGKQKYFQSV